MSFSVSVNSSSSGLEDLRLGMVRSFGVATEDNHGGKIWFLAVRAGRLRASQFGAAVDRHVGRLSRSPAIPGSSRSSREGEGARIPLPPAPRLREKVAFPRLDLAAFNSDKVQFGPIV